MNRKPLYRRPWLWIVVLLLLIAGGWFINYRSQTQEAPRDTVAKISKKTDKKKEVAKKPQDKEKDHSLTKPASGEQTEVNGTGQTMNTTVPQQPSIAENTVPANTQEKELWVDPDNYEPNSIIGDRSTMYCYLPGQYPDPGIAPENVVYFDSLAEAQAAGYRTRQ
jgi:hypothetical protein